jgi:hypothetical protein
MEVLSQHDSPTLKRPSAKAIPSLCIQLPDIYSTKVIFVKDEFPDFIFPPVSIAPSLNLSRPSAKTTNPLA